MKRQIDSQKRNQLLSQTESFVSSCSQDPRQLYHVHAGICRTVYQQNRRARQLGEKKDSLRFSLEQSVEKYHPLSETADVY